MCLEWKLCWKIPSLSITSTCRDHITKSKKRGKKKSTRLRASFPFYQFHEILQLLFASDLIVLGRTGFFSTYLLVAENSWELVGISGKTLINGVGQFYQHGGVSQAQALTSPSHYHWNTKENYIGGFFKSIWRGEYKAIKPCYPSQTNRTINTMVRGLQRQTVNLCGHWVPVLS